MKHSTQTRTSLYVSDAIGFAGYFAFFWLFLLNSRFRHAQIEEWQQGGWPERLFILFEAVVSFTIGVAVPVGVLSTLF